MNSLNDLTKKIENGTNTFVAVCTNANRDLPFHDYDLADTTTQGMYVVGDNNIDAQGDQKKHFVSKSTLLIPNSDLDIQLNSQKNVAITLLANVHYEFKSNIHSIFWAASAVQESWLKIYCEGVMYHESRRPE